MPCPYPGVSPDTREGAARLDSSLDSPQDPSGAAAAQKSGSSVELAQPHPAALPGNPRGDIWGSLCRAGQERLQQPPTYKKNNDKEKGLLTPPETQPHQKAMEQEKQWQGGKHQIPRENTGHEQGWESVIPKRDEGQLEGKGSLRAKTKQEKGKGKETRRSGNSETKHVTTC